MQSLIIINGPPGSGKSYLGKILSAKMAYPYISKDEIKETLFDTLGCSDREWSKKLGQASFETLFQLLKTQLQNGISCIVETAFFPSIHSRKFEETLYKLKIKTIQIYCNADDDILAKRFVDRVQSQERHSGHVDDRLSEPEFKNMLKSQKYGKLDIFNETIEFSTNDFSKCDYEALYKSVVSMVSKHF